MGTYTLRQHPSHRPSFFLLIFLHAKSSNFGHHNLILIPFQHPKRWLFICQQRSQTSDKIQEFKTLRTLGFLSPPNQGICLAFLHANKGNHIFLTQLKREEGRCEIWFWGVGLLGAQNRFNFGLILVHGIKKFHDHGTLV